MTLEDTAPAMILAETCRAAASLRGLLPIACTFSHAVTAGTAWVMSHP
jgi:hypothetical protein